MSEQHPPETKRASRRRFLGTAATFAAGAFGVPLFVPRRALSAPGRPGANDRISVAAIGFGSRARLLLEQLPQSAQLVAVADCFLANAESCNQTYKLNGAFSQDYRRVLDRKDVDAVIVATGDFQRVLPCIHACQAGKDIYAEKPLTLYVREGRALVDAVRHSNRVLQVGSQQRSMEMNRVACELVRSGRLGKVLEVRAMNYPGPQPAPHDSILAQEVWKGFDWNMWLNQAAWREFNGQWLSWRQFRDFSGGEMTDWGAHGVDQIQWALGMDGSGPAEIRPRSPGRNGEVAMRYPNGVEVNFMLPMGRGPMGGAIFICEQGKLEINRNKFTSNPPEIAAELRKKVNVVEEERKWSNKLALWQARWHMQNWLDCIRTRNRPVADVEIGHRSVTVCHLANIVRVVGRPLRWDASREQFEGDEEANRYLDRSRRHGFELPTTSGRLTG
jgi:predicted dehydrogenase